MYTIDSFMNFIRYDSKIYHDKGYEIHAIMADDEKFLDNFKEVKNLDYINWHRVNTYSGNYLKKLKKSDYIKSNKPAIIYMSGLAGDIDNISSINPNAYLYITTTQPNNFLKVKYEKEGK